VSGAEYSFALADPFGGDRWRYDVTPWVFSADLRREENAIGAATVQLAVQNSHGQGLPDWCFKRDVRLMCYQQFPGRGKHLLFDQVYLLRLFERDRDARSCQGSDLMGLLDTRVIAYKSGAAGSSTTDAIDDAIKELARQNLGSGATDTTRSWESYITVAGDLAAAPATSKAFSYNRLYDTMATMAKESAGLGTYLAFDLMAQSERQFIFATYTGQRGRDRRESSTTPLIFSEDRRNVANVRLIEDYRGEVTRGYAGAKGTGTDRNIQSANDQARIDASPFGLREEFRDCTNIEQKDTTGATNVAAGLVRQGRPRVLASADYVETPSTVYGLHFGYGDYATFKAYGYVFDVRLSRVTARIGRGSLADAFKDDFGISFRVEGELDR
jgi:hypothetical protein